MVWRNMKPCKTQDIVVNLLHLTNILDKGRAIEAEGGGDFGAPNPS